MEKIALVTGASSGIGRNSAVTLANNGYTVVATARRLDQLNETAAMSDGHIVPVQCDVSDPSAVEKLFDEVRSRFGRLDVVFNNAGTAVPMTNFGDLEYSDFKSVMDVNLTGAYLIANAAYKMMRDQEPQGGRIINNGSIAAYMPRPGSAPYTISKHAITGLTRSISLDGRGHNIACSQIDIGNAASDISAGFADGVQQADGSTKVEPLMDVQHVGDAVLHISNLPLDANVLFMTLMANSMPYVGRG